MPEKLTLPRALEVFLPAVVVMGSLIVWATRLEGSQSSQDVKIGDAQVAITKIQDAITKRDESFVQMQLEQARIRAETEKSNIKLDNVQQTLNRLEESMKESAKEARTAKAATPK